MKILLVNEKISEQCEIGLVKEGFTIMKLAPDMRLGEGVCRHPDTLAFYSKGELITTAEYCDDAAYIFSDLREYCPWLKISFTADKRGAKYPDDAVMNALLMGGKIFCNTDIISSGIKELAERCGLEIRHVNQGYPACTVLAFGNSAITADPGMARALRDSGAEVTLIEQGGISLPPYEYGFIGGASGVYGEKVYFFGSLDTHPQGEIIRRTVEAAGFTAVSLSDEPLTDLGGFIAL